MADVSSNLYQWSTTAASNNPSGTTTIGTGLDDNLREIQAVVRTEYDKTVPALDPGGRLTLTTAVAVTTSDVTAATTLYYTPYKHDKVVLFDGTNWRQYTFTERSIAVPATTATMYDVFLYDNAGTLTLELTAWTNDTTRATALTTQNGVQVKTGATTRRYLGSFRTTGVSGQTEDSAAKRFVWNYYNRVGKKMRAVDTGSWNYTTATIRQANANTANQIDFVRGLDEDAMSARVVHAFSNSSANVQCTSAIGLDSTSSFSTDCTRGAAQSYTVNGVVSVHAGYTGYPGIGRHFLSWNEISVATGTTTWYAANTDALSGITGEARC